MSCICNGILCLKNWPQKTHFCSVQPLSAFAVGAVGAALPHDGVFGVVLQLGQVDVALTGTELQHGRHKDLREIT